VTSLGEPGSTGRAIYISVGFSAFVELFGPWIRFSDGLLNPVINLQLLSKTQNCFTNAAIIFSLQRNTLYAVHYSHPLLKNNKGINIVTRSLISMSGLKHTKIPLAQNKPKMVSYRTMPYKPWTCPIACLYRTAICARVVSRSTGSCRTKFRSYSFYLNCVWIRLVSVLAKQLWQTAPKIISAFAFNFSVLSKFIRIKN
jgi:hypothetical protein